MEPKFKRGRRLPMNQKKNGGEKVYQKVNRDEPATPIFPEEITEDILSRLPVASLCRFRCVSKLWRYLIADPHLIKIHFNRNHKRLFLMKCAQLCSLDLESSGPGAKFVAVPLNIPNLPTPSNNCDFYGSCDGLVLWVNDDKHNCFLINPSTRESRELPESPFQHYGIKSYGLGHDSSCDDYRVVIISTHGMFSGSVDNLVTIYSLRTNLWRRIEDSPYDHHYCRPTRGAFVSGALHWIACSGTGSTEDNVIVSLDLADEKFGTVPTPCSVESLELLYVRLGVLGGCLCVYFIQASGCMDVWMMKEYGVRDSWVKSTVNYGRFNYCKLLYLSRNGEVLLDISGNKVVAYNQQKEEYKDLKFRGCPSCLDIEAYVESFVSPQLQQYDEEALKQSFAC